MKKWLALALALAAACEFPSPKQQPDAVPARGPRSSTVVPAVYYRSGDFIYGRAVRLEDLKLSPGPMMTMAVARVKNIAGLDYRLEFRFRFFDLEGRELKSDDTARWKKFEIAAGGDRTLSDACPSEAVTKAGLEIREPFE